MITWFKLWPLCLLPLVLLILLSLIPEIPGVNFSGKIFMEDLTNNTLLEILPYETGWSFVSWYKQSAFNQYMAHLLISVNITALLLPITYIIGSMIIMVRNKITLSEIRSRRTQVKQH